MIKTIFAISFLIIALSIGYYFVIYLPHKDAAQQAAIESQQMVQQQVDADKKAQQKSALDSCLDAAEQSYTTNWNTACKTLGLNTTNAGCNLPQNEADRIDQSRNDDRSICLKEYPQN